ncbi:MAG TPA: sialidase family protein [Microbacteriaceae bacterium]|nr:sialidase family protein [Microbacteriaceae bacterium]
MRQNMRSIRIAVAALTGLGLAFAGVHAASATGPSWEPPVVVSNAADHFTGFLTQAAPDGAIVTVWIDSVNDAYQLYASTSQDGLEWSTPVAIGDPSGGMTWPTLAVDGNGVFVTAWRSITGGNAPLYVSRSTDGATWSAPVSVSDPSTSAEGVAVAGRATGGFVLAWIVGSGENGRVYVARSSDGATWGPAAISEASGETVSFPAITAASDGRTLVTYRSTDGSTSWLNTFERSASGTWTTTPHIASSPTGFNFVTVAPTTETGYAAIWANWDGITGFTEIASSADGVTWSTPTRLSAETSMTALNQQLVRMSTGRLIAAWSEVGDPTQTRYTAISDDNGATWDEPVAFATGVPRLWGLAFRIDQNDELAAVFDDNPDGTGRHMQFRTSTDGVNWSDPEELGGAPHRGETPQLVSLGDGTWVAVWTVTVDDHREMWASARTPSSAPSPSESASATAETSALATTGVDTAWTLSAIVALLAGGILLSRARRAR